MFFSSLQAGWREMTPHRFYAFVTLFVLLGGVAPLSLFPSSLPGKREEVRGGREGSEGGAHTPGTPPKMDCRAPRKDWEHRHILGCVGLFPDLSMEQKAQLARIAKWASEVEEHRPHLPLHGYVLSARERIASVLTPEQQEKYWCLLARRENRGAGKQ